MTQFYTFQYEYKNAKKKNTFSNVWKKKLKTRVKPHIFNIFALTPKSRILSKVYTNFICSRVLTPTTNDLNNYPFNSNIVNFACYGKKRKLRLSYSKKAFLSDKEPFLEC